MTSPAGRQATVTAAVRYADPLSVIAYPTAGLSLIPGGRSSTGHRLMLVIGNATYGTWGAPLVVARATRSGTPLRGRSQLVLGAANVEIQAWLGLASLPLATLNQPPT